MMGRSHSRSELYLHLVWATRGREPLLTPHLERSAWKTIETEAKRLGCSVLAVCGMEDHVHLLVMVPPSLAVDDVAARVKEASAQQINTSHPEVGGFGWSEGYGVFSVSRSHVKRVMAYVLEQKRHHQLNALWPEWEETDEESTAEEEWSALLQ
jgi:putative transposase